MPQVGEVEQNLWLAAAFGDHTMTSATMAGDLIARAIAEGDDRWRLFSSYGLVWSAGLAGKAVASMALRATRVRAWMGEALAQSRGKIWLFAASTDGDGATPAPLLLLPPPAQAPQVENTSAEATPEATTDAVKATPRVPRKRSAVATGAVPPETVPRPREKRRQGPASPQETLRPKRRQRRKAPAVTPAMKPNDQDTEADAANREAD
jgi:hypothetical protein